MFLFELLIHRFLKDEGRTLVKGHIVVARRTVVSKLLSMQFIVLRSSARDVIFSMVGHRHCQPRLPSSVRALVVLVFLCLAYLISFGSIRIVPNDRISFFFTAE